MPLKVLRRFKTDELEDAFSDFEKKNPDAQILSIQYIGQDINDPYFGCMIYYKVYDKKSGEWII